MGKTFKPEALTVGQRIRKSRKALGMTQAKLEEVSGVSQNHISNLECGVSNLGLDALEKLVPALQVTREYLMTGKNSSRFLIPQLEEFMGWAAEQDEETQLKISSILVNIREMIK